MNEVYMYIYMYIKQAPPHTSDMTGDRTSVKNRISYQKIPDTCLSVILARFPVLYERLLCKQNFFYVYVHTQTPLAHL